MQLSLSSLLLPHSIRAQASSSSTGADSSSGTDDSTGGGSTGSVDDSSSSGGGGGGVANSSSSTGAGGGSGSSTGVASATGTAPAVLPFVVQFAGRYPIDWNLVPATQPTFTVEENKELGPCICDLTVGNCDVNCRCDPDW
jgi:hypothetical protein